MSERENQHTGRNAKVRQSERGTTTPRMCVLLLFAGRYLPPGFSTLSASLSALSLCVTFLSPNTMV